MLRRILPPALPPGGGIGVCSPSFPGPAIYPLRTHRAIGALEGAGFRVTFPEEAAAQSGYLSASAENRAAAIMKLFADPSVHAIVTSVGGFNSNAILPFLDYDFIAQHPKILVGYSDSTALLLGIYARSGLVTFHGPSLLPQWGEIPEPLAYTMKSFLEITANSQTGTVYAAPDRWTNQRIDWGTEAQPQSRTEFFPVRWVNLRSGSAQGILLGGNIETLNFLIGSAYFPDFKEALLLVEATSEEAYLPRLDRALEHLGLAGVLGQVRGLMAARCPDTLADHGVAMCDVLRHFGDRYDIPVAADLDFGHTDPMMTIPLGISAELSCSGDAVALRLLEPAVARAVSPDAEKRPFF